MQKRGQVAIFVVIGIAVLIVFILLFTFRDAIVGITKKQIDTEQYLNDQLLTIQREVIDKCVVDETNNAVNLFLKNGGQFNEPSNYLKYSTIKYKVLCQNIPGSQNCLSTPISIKKINEDFNSYLKDNVFQCMDFTDFQNDNYELILPDEFLLNVQINSNDILVEADYVVELKRDQYDVKGKKVTETFDIPLGEIIEATNGVLDFRSKFGIFDPVVYDATSHSKYEVTVEKPYPDEVYDVSLREYPNFHFKFAITSEGRYDRLETSRI